MTRSNIISFAKQFAILGSITACVMIIMFCTGYFIIYKKLLKKSGKLSKCKLITSFIFLSYLVFVFGATFLTRAGGYSNNYQITNLIPFTSYKEAWNSFSETEWRNLILNIILFVPMGVLVPIVSPKLQKFWKTCGIGLVISLCIEVIQYIFKRGIVEFDDVLNNTLGTMIGFGIIMLILYIAYNKKMDTQRKAYQVVLLQLPLVGTVMIFCFIFFCYNMQEFGNIPENYTNKVALKGVTITLNTTPSEDRTSAMMYRTQVGTQEDTLAVANEILKNFDTSVDEESPDLYQDTVVYRSKDGKYSLWVDYKGLTTWFIEFGQVEQGKKEGLNEKQIRQALSTAGITLPEDIEFEENGQGNYTIRVSMEVLENRMLDGTLTCCITTSGRLDRFENNIIVYKPVRECDIITEKEGYQILKEGKFKYNELFGKIKTIVVNEINLSYRMDSKGFYQPMYEFGAEINDCEATIVIPALR